MTIRFELRTTKKSFLVVREGENTEPEYFNAFRLTSATVKALGRTPNEYHRSSTEPSLF